MELYKNPLFEISPEVLEALSSNKPIISLESSAITHGIPFPDNIETFNTMQTIIRQNDIVPALIGVLNGKIKLGFSDNDIEYMVKGTRPVKLNSADISWALCNHLTGGTTISATTFISKIAGIEFFVSGGIGGVHLGDHIDISSDLHELSCNQVMLICSGIKAILSVADTVEILETLSVPIVGYQTDRMPGFIIRDTGIQLNKTSINISDVVEQYKIHKSIERSSAFIVVVSPPEEVAIPLDTFKLALEKANHKAKQECISGSKLTPFLLEIINDELSGSIFSVIKPMLINNVGLGCEIVNQYRNLQK